VKGGRKSLMTVEVLFIFLPYFALFLLKLGLTGSSSEASEKKLREIAFGALKPWVR